jgi:hypothetical protein
MTPVEQPTAFELVIKPSRARSQRVPADTSGHRPKGMSRPPLDVRPLEQEDANRD